MTPVAILPVPTEKGVSYQGTAGDKHLRGRTLGEALDALTPQLPNTEEGLLVVVQSLRPDQFFDTAQQRRLGESMAAWRQAREREETLAAAEQDELDALVEAELSASASRAARLADEAGR